MRKTSFIFMVITVFCASLWVGTSGDRALAEETIKLKLAFGGSPKPFSARGSAFWAKEVERRTGGKVKISLHYGGSLPDTVKW